MATDLETLTLRIEASAKKFESDMARVQKTFDGQARALERRSQAAVNKMEAAFGSVGQRISAGLRASFAGVAAALSGRELIQAADTFTRIQNNLRVAGLSGEQLTGTFQRLYQIAQDNAVPLEGLSELYGRVSAAQKTIGATSSELVGFTSTVAQALQLTGKSASEASGALLQLGQALGGGTIQAQEYNSLIDGLRPLLEAAAAGLKEAGGDVAKLTALVKDGKVSSQAFFRAIEAGAPILQAKLSNATQTTEQGMVRLNNAFVVAVGELDKVTGTTDTLNTNLSALAGYLEKLPALIEASTRQWGYFKDAANQAAGALNRFLGIDDDATRAAGLDVIRNGRVVPPPGAAGTGGGFGTGPTDAELEARREAARARAISNLPRQVTPVSLKDFGTPGSGSNTASAYERETEAINQKIEALRVEASTVGQTTAAVERAKIALELETAAKEANKAAGLGANIVTAAQKVEIDRLSAAYAAAKVQVENLENAQRDAIASMDAVRSTAGSTLGTFANDIAEGTSEMEALKSAVDSVRAALVNAFANQLIAGLLGPTGTAGTGILGAFFGRAGGGPVNAGQPYTVGESGRETFVPTTAGRIIPAGGRGSTITYAPVIDARGADAGAVARLEAVVRRQSEELRTIAGAGRAQKRGMRA